jgi:hypothetical protein
MRATNAAASAALICCFRLCRLRYSVSQKLKPVASSKSDTRLVEALAAGSEASQILQAELLAAA